MEVRAGTEPVRRLLQAAVEGDVEYIESIRASGGDGGEEGEELLRNAVCKSGCTLLHWAAGSGQVGVLRYLLSDERGRVFPGPDVPVTACKKGHGRTPLHYSCRNGHLEATRWLVMEAGADVSAKARHGVTPFQLAVWQNQLDVCRWLVDGDGTSSGGGDGGGGWVDPAKELNDFDCGAVHWLGICPVGRANFTAIGDGDAGDADAYCRDGRDLLPLAEWLATQPGVDFSLAQRQGHTALHKASWGGHLALVRHLHTAHGLWDDVVDRAGNYAASLADMANTPRHRAVAAYLRKECSRARAASCTVLGIPVTADRAEVRRAYLARARLLHPDRALPRPLASHEDGGRPRNGRRGSHPGDDDVNGGPSFDGLHTAYVHLMEQDGIGDQSNPAHSLNLMLRVSGQQDERASGANAGNGGETGEGADGENVDDSCFKARLIAVLLEYGDKGIDLSNIKKKWNQVWPAVPFPVPNDGKSAQNKQARKTSLKTMLMDRAGDVIRLDRDGKGGLLVFPKNCSQASVAHAAQTISNI